MLGLLCWLHLWELELLQQEWMFPHNMRRLLWLTCQSSLKGWSHLLLTCWWVTHQSWASRIQTEVGTTSQGVKWKRKKESPYSNHLLTYKFGFSIQHFFFLVESDTLTDWKFHFWILLHFCVPRYFGEGKRLFVALLVYWDSWYCLTIAG